MSQRLQVYDLTLIKDGAGDFFIRRAMDTGADAEARVSGQELWRTLEMLHRQSLEKAA